MNDDTARICVEIFRKATGLDMSERGASTSDEDILNSPISAFEIDSLETMEFIMAVEDRFNIELNEEAVNGCRNIAELVQLVTAARVRI
jgi:acyl carrier protein